MTRLHRDEDWNVTPGDTASMVVDDQRIHHTVASRDKDTLTMRCGAKAMLRRYYTQEHRYPFASSTWLPVNCLGCLGAMP